MIKVCLLTGPRQIELVGSDMGDIYDCEVHTAERQYCVEKFIGHGWYEFAKNRSLKRGDKVGFNILHPPA